MKFMGLGFRAETLGLSWAPRLHPSRLYLQVPVIWLLLALNPGIALIEGEPKGW